LSELNWHDIDYFDNIPKDVLFWIGDDQSLTQKLKKKYPDFRVEVHKQEESSIYNHEINQIGNEENFIVREVSLYGDNEPVVFARSVIPENTKTQSIMEIGNKPLGEILFTDPNILREPIEITFQNNVWGRRSVFVMNDSRILVSEFFLEKIYA
jgi:chorismate--pyruvate lyase